MNGEARSPARRVGSYVHERAQHWRTGSRQSQLNVLSILLGCVTASFLVSLYNYQWMPLTAYFFWLLLGMLLLRFAKLVVLAVYAPVAAFVAMVVDGPITLVRMSALIAVVLSVALILFQSSRQRSGLPGPLSEALLGDLKDRLQAQGRIPELEHGWHSQTAMLASEGVGYAGDFLVTDLSEDGQHLEVILVDVCGKGLAAGPIALQFAGALGGLIRALPQPELFHAANDFLLGQHDDDSFSTAVHLQVDLVSGDYTITSAGHPPALRWQGQLEEWVFDDARGTALGVTTDPELHRSQGTLRPGEALLFYTDGVVETRSTHIDIGMAWLQQIAGEAVRTGFPGAAGRIIRQVERGDDDRAVLILSRSLEQPAPAVSDPRTAHG